MYKLNNFWASLRSSVQIISGNWNFIGSLKVNGEDVLTELNDLSGVLGNLATLNSEVTTINGEITTINTILVAIPTGGATGTRLTKSSSSNYATTWSSPNYLGVFTTTAKNALTPSLGNTCFDSTLAKLCVYTGAAWETITSV